jgi:hypothetical protein
VPVRKTSLTSPKNLLQAPPHRCRFFLLP